MSDEAKKDWDAGDPTRLKFEYIHWKGDEHCYVIIPEKVEFLRLQEAYVGQWVMHGHVVSRDERDGRRVRGTFMLKNMRGIEEVAA